MFETKNLNGILKLSDYKRERGDKVEQGEKMGMQIWKERWSSEEGT